MNTPAEIKELSNSRIDEAKILFENDKYDGAFYLAGYSVELALKAKICEKIGIPNLFDVNNQETNKIDNVSEIRKVFKTHNLYFLLIMCGLKNKYDNDKASNRNLFEANSLLFNNWSENCRYKPCGHMRPLDVEKLIKLLTDDNGLLKWIELS